MSYTYGPFDYSSSALFTTNLISFVFTTLIPDIDREKPQVQCGVVLALFKDGKGITPYGFALRTNDANLLGHIQVYLGEETIDMSLDSQGRQGAGISIGSIFYNTSDRCTSSDHLGPISPFSKRHFSASYLSSLAC